MDSGTSSLQGLAVEAGVAVEQKVIDIVREKAKTAPMRCKRFRLGHIPSDGTLRRGVNGVMSETMFFLYRGQWPSKLEPRLRPSLGGSTWDDTWNNASTMCLPAYTHVPYELKAVLFDDFWSQREEEGADPVEADEDEEEQELTEKKSKKEKKHSKPQKTETPSKKRRSDPASGCEMALPPPPIVSPPSVLAGLSADTDSWEPMFHNDYPSGVWTQIREEWGASGTIVFTPGNGCSAIWSVLTEKPTLLMALNPTHAELMMYFVDSGLAESMQSAGNKLHDPTLVANLKAEDACAKGMRKTKKSKSKKQEKRTKKTNKSKSKKEEKCMVSSTSDSGDGDAVEEGSSSASCSS